MQHVYMILRKDIEATQCNTCSPDTNYVTNIVPNTVVIDSYIGPCGCVSIIHESCTDLIVSTVDLESHAIALVSPSCLRIGQNNANSIINGEACNGCPNNSTAAQTPSQTPAQTPPLVITNSSITSTPVPSTPTGPPPPAKTPPSVFTSPPLVITNSSIISTPVPTFHIPNKSSFITLNLFAAIAGGINFIILFANL